MVSALASRDTPPERAAQAAQADEVGQVGMRAQLLLVAIGARVGILAAEILHVAQPVAHHALRLADAEVGADAPVEEADLVLAVGVGGQAAQHDEAAAVGDFAGDVGQGAGKRRQGKCLRSISSSARPAARTAFKQPSMSASWAGVSVIE